jgi:hypothetical protein
MVKIKQKTSESLLVEGEEANRMIDFENKILYLQKKLKWLKN